jgi:hypothetical protein
LDPLIVSLISETHYREMRNIVGSEM